MVAESQSQGIDPKDVALARDWAKVYKRFGLQPLPSRPDAKRPMIRFADLWDQKAPDDLFDRFETTNIQLMCGRHWRLLIIDLDGEEAGRRWERMGDYYPKTWESHSGSDGKHVWYRLPRDYQHALPKAFIWRGAGEHSAVERLCDRSLVVAPPSIHPRTGRRYKFLPYRDPLSIPLADCPRWVLRLRPVESSVATKGPFQPVVNPGHRRASTPAPDGGRLDRDEILDRIRDKIGLASRWGVRFTGRPGYNGWCPCHAYDRPDNNPSAAVHAETGVYTDLGSGTRLSFFDLMVALGVASDFQDALRVLRDAAR